ncbi:14630_t:CDS:1, partial [Racocetra fulgida]
VNNNISEEVIYVTKLDFDDETVRKVHEGLRECLPSDIDIPSIICESQQEDGSFKLSPFIIDHLNQPDDVVESLKRFVGSPRLRGCDDSVWNTAFTIHYLKNILPDHENKWRDACDRASKWLSEQINDKNLEKEMFSACKQYLVKQGSRVLYATKRKNRESFRVMKLNVDEETRKAVFDYLRSKGTADLA